MRIITSVVALGAACVSMIRAAPVYAITLVNPLAPPNGSVSLTDVIGRILSTVIGLVGVIAIIMLIYAGVLWMTAGGNTKRVETAQETIKWTAIGVIIIVAAGAISSFVIEQLSAIGT